MASGVRGIMGIGNIGIMENKMETTIVYWEYLGIMEKENGNYYLGLQMHHLGFGIWDLALRVWGLGFRDTTS